MDKVEATEIIINSIDQDGMMKGNNIELMKKYIKFCQFFEICKIL